MMTTVNAVLEVGKSPTDLSAGAGLRQAARVRRGRVQPAPSLFGLWNLTLPPVIVVWSNLAENTRRHRLIIAMIFGTTAKKVLVKHL